MCLFLVLHAVILVLVMVFQVTVREESDVGTCLYGSDGEKAYEFEMSPRVLDMCLSVNKKLS